MKCVDRMEGELDHDPRHLVERSECTNLSRLRRSGDHGHLTSEFPGRHAATAMALAGTTGGGEEGQSIEMASNKRLERDCGAAAFLLLFTRTVQSLQNVHMRHSYSGPA